MRPPLKTFAERQRNGAGTNRARMRHRQLLFTTPARDLGRRRLDRALLPRQKVLLDRRQDNLLDGRFQAALSTTTGGLVRQQRRE